jgi:hypothetical protein
MDLSKEITNSENNSDVETGVKGKNGLVIASPRTKPFIVVVACCCAALGGLIFGYGIAGAGANFVMDGIQRHSGWEGFAGNAGEQQRLRLFQKLLLEHQRPCPLVASRPSAGHGKTDVNRRWKPRLGKRKLQPHQLL